MKPDFIKFDLVSTKEIGAKQALVVQSPYKKDDTWAMIVNERLFGRYDRFEWHDKEVNASEYILINRGFLGRFKNMKISKPAIVTGIALLAILFIGLTFSGNYNSLVTGRNAVDNSWAKVETQYQRRMDLIDNVVASAKGAQGNEQKVFGDIAKARSQYNSATTTDGKAQAASTIETNVALIPRLQEAYPELKSNEQISKLITELQGTENDIAATRNAYNDVVTNYNNNITRFPKNIFAGIFNFDQRKLFKSNPTAATAPKVNFDN